MDMSGYLFDEEIFDLQEALQQNRVCMNIQQKRGFYYGYKVSYFNCGR